MNIEIILFEEKMKTLKYTSEVAQDNSVARLELKLHHSPQRMRLLVNQYQVKYHEFHYNNVIGVFNRILKDYVRVFIIHELSRLHGLSKSIKISWEDKRFYRSFLLI